ncbi:MAG: hypothetical protein WDO56_24300 [Gammaproteobacteria bacterium]
MHALKGSFGKLGGQAVEFILANASEVVGMSLTELAERTGVSDSMIIKICQQLGVSGLQQLKISLAQDLVEPVQFIHEDLARRDDAANRDGEDLPRQHRRFAGHLEDPEVRVDGARGGDHSQGGAY